MRSPKDAANANVFALLDRAVVLYGSPRCWCLGTAENSELGHAAANNPDAAEPNGPLGPAAPAAGQAANAAGNVIQGPQGNDAGGPPEELDEVGQLAE